MAHLDTLSSYVSTLVPPRDQNRITPSDLAWTLEVPSLNALLVWLATLIQEDDNRGRTTALEKEEREIWDRACSLGVANDYDPATPSSSTLPPSAYLPPSELAELATLNHSMAATKERRIRQLELNIDRLQSKLSSRQLANQARLDAEAALGTEISSFDSELVSLGLLTSSTTLPTLLDLLSTSLTPHLHPSSSTSLPLHHLTQSPALFLSFATASQDLASKLAVLQQPAPPSISRQELRQMADEETRLAGVFAATNEDSWEREMESYLNGETDLDEPEQLRDDLVRELMDAGRDKDRLEELEREVALLKATHTHLSSTLLPTALLLHQSLFNDVSKLRELDALLFGLVQEISALQAGEFKGFGSGEAAEEGESEATTKWQAALLLLTSSTSTSHSAVILTPADFLSSLSSLTTSVASSTASISSHMLSLARYASRSETLSSLQPLLSPLLSHTPTTHPSQPLLARSPALVRAERKLDVVWKGARVTVNKWRWLGEATDKEAGEGGERGEGKKAVERLVRDNPPAQKTR